MLYWHLPIQHSTCKYSPNLVTFYGSLTYKCFIVFTQEWDAFLHSGDCKLHPLVLIYLRFTYFWYTKHVLLIPLTLRHGHAIQNKPNLSRYKFEKEYVTPSLKIANYNWKTIKLVTDNINIFSCQLNKDKDLVLFVRTG